MSENPKRVIRARVLEDNTECLYANKGVFMEFFNFEDKERVKGIVSQYTNLENEARLLLHDIQNKKTQVSDQMFSLNSFPLDHRFFECNKVESFFSYPS